MTKGNNPALLNESDADPDVYTVDHGMTTKDLEQKPMEEKKSES